MGKGIGGEKRLIDKIEKYMLPAVLVIVMALAIYGFFAGDWTKVTFKAILIACAINSAYQAFLAAKKKHSHFLIFHLAILYIIIN